MNVLKIYMVEGIVWFQRKKVLVKAKHDGKLKKMEQCEEGNNKRYHIGSMKEKKDTLFSSQGGLFNKREGKIGILRKLH